MTCFDEIKLVTKGKIILLKNRILNNFISRIKFIFGVGLKIPNTMNLEILYAMDTCIYFKYVCIESKASNKFYLYSSSPLNTKSIIANNYYKKDNNIILG
jgi:hypothetical protein